MAGFTPDQLVKLGQIGGDGDNFYAASRNMLLKLLDLRDKQDRRMLKMTDHGYLAEFAGTGIDVTVTKYCDSFDGDSPSPECAQPDHEKRESCYVRNYYCDCFRHAPYAPIRPKREGTWRRMDHSGVVNPI